MLGQNLEMSIKTRKKVNINIRPLILIFWNTDPTFTRRQSFNTFILTETSTAMHPSPMENKLTLHKRTFMPIKPFATTPGPLKGFDSP
jgi:hypothetical protein